jgi:hypothetical protein
VDDWNLFHYFPSATIEKFKIGELENSTLVMGFKARESYPPRKFLSITLFPPGA